MGFNRTRVSRKVFVGSSNDANLWRKLKRAISTTKEARRVVFDGGGYREAYL